MLKGPSFRKRMAVQKAHVKPKQEPKPQAKKRFPEVRKFLLNAIWMYYEALRHFEPLSDEWVICQNELFEYKKDFELLENGTHEERKEVIDKYG